jgi:hypothetical protein
MASYRCLTDLFLPAPECRYASAGDILSDHPGPGEIPIPVGWSPPTHACDPLDPDALERYWEVGPRFSDVEIWRATFTNSGRWSNQPVSKPSTWWERVNVKNPGEGYQLNNSNLGPRPPM